MELIIILLVIIVISDVICVHSYEDVDRFKVFSARDNGYSHTIVHCRCEKCGKYKSFKIK